MQLIDTLIPIVALVRQTIAPAADTRGAFVDRAAPAEWAASDAGAQAGDGAVAAPAAPATSAPATAPAASSAAAASPFAPTPVAAFEWPAGSVEESAGTARAADVPTRTRSVGPDGPARVPAAASPASATAAPARALAERLDALIDSARYVAARADIAATTFDDGLFAVLAWADETLISSHWPGAAQWSRYLLQRKYFNSTTAGVAFFARLEQLRDDQADVREVYALCLSMGFKGRFAYERATRALDETRRTTLQRVLDDAGVPIASSALLFPQAYTSGGAADPERIRPELNRPTPRPRFAISRQTVLAIGIPLVVLALLYGTYRLIIAQLIDAILPLIQ